MNIKTKIQVALLVVFAGFALMGAINGYYLDALATNSARMMRDNYRSLDYTHEMTLALEDVTATMLMPSSGYSFRRMRLREAFDRFERYLALQNQSVDSQKEQELTDQLQYDYENFRRQTEKLFRQDQEFGISLYMQYTHIRDLINKVYSMNKTDLRSTNEAAKSMSERVKLYMIVLGLVIFILAVLAMFLLPDLFAEPFRQMTERMKQIAQRDYSQRVEVRSDDELGEMASSFNLMAEKLEEYDQYNLEQVLSEKTRIERLIARMREAIIGMDSNHTILFANPVALRLLEVKEEEMIGRNALQVAAQHPLFAQMLEGLTNENQEVEEDNTNLLPVVYERNGQTFYFNRDILWVNQQPEGAVSNVNLGYVIVLKNITKLKEENIAKTNFMARLSHELKTPIAAIDMSVNLLQDERVGGIQAEREELSQTIRQNTSRMIRMVNEILDFSKIETGSVQLTKRAVQPQVIVDNAIKAVKTFLHDKHIEVIQEVEADLPKVEMDTEKITDVLVNFLTNAIRYTDRNGSIKIKVNSLIDAVSFSVSDDGPGIPIEEQPYIFQKFHRAKNDSTKGTGLGLTISKEFVKAHDGRIWVNSIDGKGSTFYFSLPIV